MSEKVPITNEAGSENFIFSQFSGMDFFLFGLSIGSLFDRFTTFCLLFLYIIYMNKKIAGIESRAILRYFYTFIEDFFISMKMNIEKKKEMSEENAKNVGNVEKKGRKKK